MLFVALFCLWNSWYFSRGQAGGTCETCCGVIEERARGHVTHVVGSWTSAPEEHQHASHCLPLLKGLVMRPDPAVPPQRCPGSPGSPPVLQASACFLLFLLLCVAFCRPLLFLVASCCFVLLLLAFCFFLLLIVASSCLCNICQFPWGQAGGTCDTCSGVMDKRVRGTSACFALLFVAFSCFFLLVIAS